ncbi:hypothetical protein EYF80_050755 [Liparis tanakae]|uniref:Uncharacterized protein n=1 Tax=Liparis tanakae TaxID=230148 RepID=A0A4Z2FCX1_9TELE|nr:hypothetical protein EYF80_050755 [Liparis tanakae]
MSGSVDTSDYAAEVCQSFEGAARQAGRSWSAASGEREVAVGEAGSSGGGVGRGRYAGLERGRRQKL